MVKRIQNEKTTTSIPTIITTGRSGKDNHKIISDAGAHDLLEKPFTMSSLQNKINNLMKLKTKEKELKLLNDNIAKNILQSFLPPKQIQRVLNGELILAEDPITIGATVLFVDICNFSDLSEKHGPTKIGKLLNVFFKEMSQTIFENNGAIDKFIGDSIMTTFGVYEPMTPQKQVFSAINTASRMHEIAAKINQLANIPEKIQVSIGIHHGPVTSGNFGTEQKPDYTVIGKTVNVASRVEAIAEPGTTFVTETVRDYITGEIWSFLGHYNLKGVTGDVGVYKIDRTQDKNAA